MRCRMRPQPPEHLGRSKARARLHPAFDGVDQVVHRGVRIEPVHAQAPHALPNPGTDIHVMQGKTIVSTLIMAVTSSASSNSNPMRPSLLSMNIAANEPSLGRGVKEQWGSAGRAAAVSPTVRSTGVRGRRNVGRREG
eukprot:6180712-Pleurochrysis_carterae.AAC.3